MTFLKQGRVYLTNAETGEVTEFPAAASFEIICPADDNVDDAALPQDFTVRVPLKFVTPRRALSAVGFMPPYRFKRASRQLRKRARR